MNRRSLLALALAGGVGATAAACGGGDDPLASDTASASATSAVIVGSANFNLVRR